MNFDYYSACRCHNFGSHEPELLGERHLLWLT